MIDIREEGVNPASGNNLEAFTTLMGFVLSAEGGYVNNPNDNGGETNFGITNAAFINAQGSGFVSSEITIEEMTQADAINIYEMVFWNDYGLNVEQIYALDPGSALVLFDMSINSGRIAAVTNLQETLEGEFSNFTDGHYGYTGPLTLSSIANYSGNLAEDYIQNRREYYADLIERDPTQLEFKDGWENRLIHLEEYLDENYPVGDNSHEVSVPSSGETIIKDDHGNVVYRDQVTSNLVDGILEYDILVDFFDESVDPSEYGSICTAETVIDENGESILILVDKDFGTGDSIETTIENEDGSTKVTSIKTNSTTQDRIKLVATMKDGVLELDEATVSVSGSDEIELNIHIDLQSPLIQSLFQVNINSIYDYSISDAIITNTPDLGPFVGMVVDTNFVAIIKDIVVPARDEHGNFAFDENGKQVFTTEKVPGFITIDENENSVTAWSDGTYDIKRDSITITKDTTGIVDVTLNFDGAEHPIDVGSIGSVFGNSIGAMIASDNQFTQVASSAIFSTIGANLADTLAIATTESTIGEATDQAFSDFGMDLKGASIGAIQGAISSFIVAELVGQLGLGDGENAKFASSVGGAYVTAIVANGFDATTVDYSKINVSNIVASYIGKRIGEEVYATQTSGGAIGASVGSSVGAIIGSPFLPPLGSLIGAAIGHVVGGFLGDLFGSPPRSGADVLYNAETGEFYATNIWERHGGSESTAESLANFAAGKLNFVVEMIGGDVSNETVIDAGTYGLRKDKVTYNGSGGNHRFNDAGDMITYGVVYALDKIDIAGGNVFVKRAIFNAVDQAINSNEIDSTTLDEIIGVTSFALDYEKYVKNSGEINTVMMAERSSVFTQTWIAVLKMAHSLGWTERQEADHFGGWQHLIEQEYAQDFSSESGIKKLGLYNAVQFSYSNNERGITIDNQVGPDTFIHDYVGGGAKTEIQFANVTDEFTQEQAQAQLDEALSDEPAEIIEDDGAEQVLEKVRVAAVITGTDGVDVIFSGDQGNDVLAGGGDDIITGGKLADWLIGGEGNDTLNAGGGNNNALFGEEDNDTLNGAQGSDWLDGGSGVDTLRGNGGDDILDGGTGNDNLYGGAGNDTYLFKRGDGQDIISDTDADFNEALAALNDFTGLAALGSNGEIAGGKDTIEFGEGISLSHINIKLDESSNTLTITLLDDSGEKTTDTLSIQNWNNTFHRIETLQFADGQSIELTNIESFITGGSGNDTITGSTGADFIHGGAGDDEIHALAGDDVAIGGLGNDNVSGDADNDLVVGGDGNDNLYGGSGNDIVSGDAGNDTLAGGTGNDVLSGGKGDDIINTGAGDDTVIFGRGDGHDTLTDAYLGEEDVVIATFGGTGGIYDIWVESGFSFNGANGTIAFFDYENLRIKDGFISRVNSETGVTEIVSITSADTGTEAVNLGNDILELKIGTNLEDLRVKQDGQDLILAIENPTNTQQNFDNLNDSIRIKNWYAISGAASIETLRLFGLADIDLTSFSSFQNGDNENDTLTGTADKDWITSGGGQDVVRAGAGDDIVSGGGSNDIIEGGAGADILFGGHGQDTLSYESSNAGVIVNFSGVEQRNEDGDIIKTKEQAKASGGDAQGDVYDGFENITGSNHNDILIGDAGDNIIDAGKGSDVVAGGLGDDTYIFNQGDGTLRIQEAGNDIDPDEAGEDVLEFGEGITPADLNFEKVNTWDLVITFEGSIDTIILENWFYDDSNKVEYLVFASGGTMDIRNQLFLSEGSVTEDWIQGTNGNDNLIAQDANDILSGRDGDDILNGGKHDDTLIGGNGADILNGGTGNDTAAYYDSTSAVTLALDSSIAATGGTAQGDTFTSIENVIGSEFADNISGDRFNNIINGGRGDDIINGGGGADTLQGGDGLDTIYGGTGSDIISGHEGNDILSGGLGYDTIGGGAGDDTINGDGGNDTLIGGTGHDIIFGGAGDDVIQGGLDNDILYGNSGNDDLKGGAGADKLFGGAGNDVLYGEAGADIIEGGDGDDFIKGGAGNDTLKGDTGADVLVGGSGDDTLTGGEGNDTLVGDEGDDIIVGNEGDDFLIGGAGNDILQGGSGTDYYVFSGDFGQDTVIEAADRQTLDEIIFSGIKANQLWFEQDGQDLIISVIGTDNQVTIENFARFRISNDESGQVLKEIEQALLDMSPVKAIQVDGAALSLAAVNDMLDAMSGFEKPTSSNDLPDTVQAVQTASWEETEITALEAHVDYTPVLNDHVYTLTEDTQFEGTLSATDQNPDDLLSYNIIRQPSNGELVLDDVTGAFVFIPDADFYGEVIAQVSVTDSTGLTDTAILRFNVTPDNDPLDVVFDVVILTAEDEAVFGNLEFNDSDNVFTDYTLSHTLNAEQGVIEFYDDGTFTYTPATNFSGINTFAITLTDPDGNVSVVNVRAEITEVNDKPVILLNESSITLTVNEGGSVEGNVKGYDVDAGDTLSYILIAYSGDNAEFYENGVLEFVPDDSGNFTIDYSANADFFGADKFVVRVTDDSYDLGDINSYAQIEVTVNVEAVNDAPSDIQWNDAVTVINEDDVTSDAIIILGSFSATDVDSTEFIFTIQNDESGLLQINSVGEIYISKTDYDILTNTDYSFKIRAQDVHDPENESKFKDQTFSFMVEISPSTSPEIVGGFETVSVELDEFSAWREEDGQETRADGQTIGSNNGDIVYTNTQLNAMFNDADADANGDGVEDELSFSIVGGNERGAFGIDAAGNIFIVDQNKLNYEDEVLERRFNLDVVAVDVDKNSSEAATIQVDLKDIDEDELIAQFNINNIGFDYILDGYNSSSGSIHHGGPYYTTSWSVYFGDYISTSNRGYRIFLTISPPNGLVSSEVSSGYLFKNMSDALGNFNPDFSAYRNWNYFYYNSLTPITLDLNGDGLEFSTQGSVLFDIDSDGDLESTAWVGANDGLLALDRNQNGIIDNGSEISFIDDLEGANSDLEGLAAYDSNGDGIFDASDARFNEFLVWQDANQNGISESDELKTLAQAGIQSINLTPTPNSESTGVSGVNLLNTSSFTFTNGATGEVTVAALGDVRFMFNEIDASDPQYATLVEGTDEADSLLGTFGQDNIEAGAGDDIVYLSDGNDLAQGGDGQDILSGGNGDDQLYGDAGDDKLRGGQGNDRLFGGTGNDRIDAGKGDDQASGGEGDDLINGNAGHDSLFGDAGDDTIFGGDGSDYLDGGDGQDSLMGGKGDDFILGGAGADVLIGGAGNDVLVGGTGNDILDGSIGLNVVGFSRGDGIDEVLANNHAVQYDLFLTGIEVQEVRFSSDGNHLILDLGEYIADDNTIDEEKILFDGFDMEGLFDSVESGSLSLNSITFEDGTVWDRQKILDEIYLDINPAIIGTQNDDVLNGTSGDELIEAYGGNDIVNAGEGNDEVYGYSGADVLHGGAGNDILDGGADNDSLYGDEGNDQLYGHTGDDILNSGTGNDTLYGGAHNDELIGGLGDDKLLGQKGNDVLYGNDGNDILSGGEGTDELHGGNGNDELRGGSENDLLMGGLGDDQLSGDEGDDVIHGELGSDILNGGEGHDQMFGGDGIDMLVGEAGNDELFGGAGNDYLFGDQGNDYLDGGTGADLLVGGAGNDTYILNSLDDVIVEDANQGIDTLEASMSISLIDSLEGSLVNIENLTLIGTAIEGTGNQFDNILIGNELNNILNGLAGSDTLMGGLGNDIYHVDNSQDVVTELSNEGTDTIVASVDFTLADNTENLMLTGDAITGNGNQLNNIIMGNEQNNILNGHDGDDELVGQAGDDTLNGGAGNDTIYGGLGDDLLNGLSGADTLVGGAGDDFYVVDNINDQVIENAQQGIDSVVSSIDLTLAAQVENLRLSGDAIFATGNALANILEGNQQNNVFDGGAGIDTLVFNRGDGQDTALKAQGSYQLELHGIRAQDVSFNVVGNLLVLELGQGDSISFTEFDVLDSEDSLPISQIQFVNDGITETLNRDDVSVWLETTLATKVGNDHINLLLGTHDGDRLHGMGGNDLLLALKGDDVLLGGKGNDALTAGQGNDRLLGGSGNDVLLGNTGNDSLDGGTGDDILLGGLGDDTYTFGIGDGKDHLLDGLGTDRIVFNDDVRLEDVWLERKGVDLIVHYSAQDQITVELGLTHGILGIDEIVIGGTVHQLNDLLASGQIFMLGGDGKDHLLGGWENNTQNAGAGNDVLSGNAGDDTLYGEAGDDRLYGGSGNDTLVGGSGDDLLDGGAGNDTYVIEQDGGYDLIANRDCDSTDTLVFAQGITLSDLSFEQDHFDLVINLNDGSDSVTINKWFKADIYQVENWVIEGVDYNSDEVAVLIQAMSSFAPSQGVEGKNIISPQDSSLAVLATNLS